MRFIKIKPRDSRYIYSDGLDKACFQHDITYGDFKDLAKTTAFEKYDAINHFILLKIQNVMDTKEILLQWFTNISIKSPLLLRQEQELFLKNQHLAKEFHKTIVRKFKRCRVYSSFNDNIWGADLADMQL